MTPQAMLKARFSELADSLGIDLSVRHQAGKFYFTVRGNLERTDKFIQNTFPGAWITSSALLEVVYGLPIEEVERVLSEIQVNPAWLQGNDAAAFRIAQHIRQEGAFEQLAILADALEESGCDNTEILNHCRASARHQQTCWVVELLLGPDRRRRRISLSGPH